MAQGIYFRLNILKMKGGSLFTQAVFVANLRSRQISETKKAPLGAF